LDLPLVWPNARGRNDLLVACGHAGCTGRPLASSRVHGLLGVTGSSPVPPMSRITRRLPVFALDCCRQLGGSDGSAVDASSAPRSLPWSVARRGRRVRAGPWSVSLDRANPLLPGDVPASEVATRVVPVGPAATQPSDVAGKRCCGVPAQQLLGCARVEQRVTASSGGVEHGEPLLGVDRTLEQREQVGHGNELSAIRSAAPGARAAVRVWNAPIRTAAADIGPGCAHQKASGSTKHFVTALRSAGATRASAATGRVGLAYTAWTDEATMGRRQPARIAADATL
jgi:hypothetical protein